MKASGGDQPDTMRQRGTAREKLSADFLNPILGNRGSSSGSRCVSRATRRPAPPIRPCGVNGIAKWSYHSCAAQGRSVTRSQAIAGTTLPANISPPEPTLIQAGKSRRPCSCYFADWNVARYTQMQPPPLQCQADRIKFFAQQKLWVDSGSGSRPNV